MLEKIRGKIYEYKKPILLFMLFIAVCLLCFYVGYLRGISSAKDSGSGVCNNGNGTVSVGEQLGNVGTNITDAKNGVESSQKELGHITNSIEYFENTVTASGDAIADCKRIIAEIRKRGKIQAVKD